MPDPVVLSLVWAEYEFFCIDADLADLQQRLSRAGQALPSCRAVANRVRLVRALLRKALAALDDDITAALK
jgi:hypothetical protein